MKRCGHLPIHKVSSITTTQNCTDRTTNKIVTYIEQYQTQNQPNNILYYYLYAYVIAEYRVPYRAPATNMTELVLYEPPTTNMTEALTGPVTPAKNKAVLQANGKARVLQELLTAISTTSYTYHNRTVYRTKHTQNPPNHISYS